MKNCAQLLLDSSPFWDYNNNFDLPDTTTIESPEEWETPDPGFAMTNAFNDEDFDSNDNVDFDATTTSSSSSPNPFINNEANENSESSSEHEEEPAFKLVVPNYLNFSFLNPNRVNFVFMSAKIHFNILFTCSSY